MRKEQMLKKAENFFTGVRENASIIGTSTILLGIWAVDAIRGNQKVVVKEVRTDGKEGYLHIVKRRDIPKLKRMGIKVKRLPK